MSRIDRFVQGGGHGCLLENKKLFINSIMIIIMTVAVSFVKYRGGEVNYLNSDATWHTLLTMEAYEETPISVHKFLPIVSLGGMDNKHISWGATIPDLEGNYYYTSFSPAGYVLPYFFVKIFHLPINEKSLYIFNTILFSISAVLWLIFLLRVYKGSRVSTGVALTGVLAYIFSPELFHGMGIVYWHQSVMQVTLLIQLLAYYIWKVESSRRAKILYFIMNVVNPYIEWTGYIANVGFAIAELLMFWKKNDKKTWKSVRMTGMLTIVSFLLFTVHYVSVVSTNDFFLALKNRFFARNFTTSVLLSDVFSGYLRSFLYLWVLVFILMAWVGVQNGRIEIRHKCLMLVLLFPLLENIVMKQHALSYSYDRMKLAFILSFLICELNEQILTNTSKKSFSILCIVINIVCCIGNVKSYLGNENYIWETCYRQNNKILANYINCNYDDSILVTNAMVRGYLNLLFGKGIYERMDIESVKNIAEAKGKEFVVEIKIDDNNSWNMYQLRGAEIYNISTNAKEYVSVLENGDLIVQEHETDGCMYE